MPPNSKDILSILKSGESETVEFKTSFDRETIETLVAFANTRGGRVFVGVSDLGEIKGVEISKESIPVWINQIKTNTASTIVPDVEIYSQRGKTIVVLEVPEYATSDSVIKIFNDRIEFFNPGGLGGVGWLKK